MLNNSRFIAIVPARGGSKRLKKKNILDLAGKPLILWTVDAAINSQYIDEVIVTSDDDEILKKLHNYNVTIIKRPDELASDVAKSEDVVKHALGLANNNFDPAKDFIVLLQPTSPLRTAEHIDAAIEAIFIKNAESIVSVCACEHSPLWTNVLPKDESMVNFINPEVRGKQGQDLAQHYRLNGAIYICRINKFLEQNTFLLNQHCYAFNMEKRFSIDIDDEYDFRIAKALITEQ